MNRAKKLGLGLLAVVVLAASYVLVGGILLDVKVEALSQKRANRIYTTFVARCRYLHAWGIAERRVTLTGEGVTADPGCKRLGWY